MLKRFVSLFLVMMLAACAIISVAAAEAEDTPSPGYYYVYTENGKALNVRDMPGGQVVGYLKNGSRIFIVAWVDENWALITFAYDKPGYGYQDYACFVSRRFLTKKKPDISGTKKAAAAADPLEALNAEFRAAKKVTPYKVLVRPSRASGWVNMHWAPSASSELLATYKANDALLVIRELPNWVQVEDQDTGDVGFISRQFIAE